MFLEILGKRPDGYHELVTLMTCVSLADKISFRVTEGDLVCASISGFESDLPAWSDNLVFRALDLLKNESGTQLGMQIRLEKRIPQQAGLGGGSSNAAAALLVANRLWGLNWTIDKLVLLAAQIGSDVPFFLYSGVGVCRGRGEKVEPVPGWWGIPVVLAMPPTGLSTQEVYSKLKLPTIQRDVSPVLAGIIQQSPNILGQSMFNRLEFSANLMTPWPNLFRKEFGKLPCLGHQLSGSGGCYFGIFSHREVALRSINLLRLRLPGVQFQLCHTGPGMAKSGWLSGY